QNPHVAQLSHARVFNMIMSEGVEIGKRGETRYNFFNKEIFGLDRPLQQIVQYFNSAAQRMEVRKRILLLMGPVGGGKSTIVTILKRGLEKYSRTVDGAVYAIKDCPMHEDPLHLVPEDLRSDLERDYGIYRNAKSRREIHLRAAHSVPGAKYQDGPFQHDLRRRGSGFAHQRK